MNAESRFTIAGESFMLMDGILGLAISPYWMPENYRRLYFHSLASNNENAVPLNSINNPAIWHQNPTALQGDFQTIGTRRIQTPGEKIATFVNRRLKFTIDFSPSDGLQWKSLLCFVESNCIGLLGFRNALYNSKHQNSRSE